MEREPKKKSRLKGLVLNLIVLSITLLIIFTVYAYRYRSYRSRLGGYDYVGRDSYAEKGFPRLTLAQSVQLGWAHKPSDRPQSSYTLVEEEKKPGTIRIGFFGCSFTRGAETAPGHDYPSFVQKMFDQAGYDNVEVINFGVGAYGMHQSFLLWQYLGTRYGLDYLVIMPYAWDFSRDNTFIFMPFTYGPLHARYVVKNGKLELVPVLGDSCRQASDIYHRLIPPWQYMRYDIKAPPFLKALIPGRRKLRVNPFYYRRGDARRGELFESYVLILKELSRGVDNVVVLANEPIISHLEKKVHQDNVQFLHSRISYYTRTFINLAPQAHHSGRGNRIIAEEIFDFLRGEKRAAFKGIRLVSKRGRIKTAQGEYPGPLYDFDTVQLALGDQPVSGFYLQFTGRGGSFRRRVDFKERKIASLLQATSGGGIAAGLPFLLEDGAPVNLTFTMRGKRVEFPIGKVQAVAGVYGRISTGKLSRERIRLASGDGWSVFLRGGITRGFSIAAQEPVTEVAILIGGQSVLHGSEVLPRRRGGKSRPPDQKPDDPEARMKPKNYSFTPEGGKFMALKCAAGQYLDVDALEKKGFFNLLLKAGDDREEMVPTFLGYKVVRRKLPPFQKPFRNPVKKSSVSRSPG